MKVIDIHRNEKSAKKVNPHFKYEQIKMCVDDDKLRLKIKSAQFKNKNYSLHLSNGYLFISLQQHPQKGLKHLVEIPIALPNKNLNYIHSHSLKNGYLSVSLTQKLNSETNKYCTEQKYATS